MKDKFILLLLLFSEIINAQIINGKILASANETPLSFAKIGIENQNFGVTSDEYGNFSIDFSKIDKTKNIIIQYNGYEPYIQKVEDFIISKNYIILLNEKIIELDEAIITQKKLIERNWGIKAKSKLVQIGFNHTKSNNDFGLEFGLLFKNKKRVKIQKINFNLVEYQLEKPLLIKYNIYSVDNELPGEPLIDENLTVNISKENIEDNTFSFDVSHNNIWINHESFFVTLQILDGDDNWIFLSGALMNSMYKRLYYGAWEKTSIAGPAINIDVKVEK